MSANKNHDRYFVPGLSRGLAVLQMFSDRGVLSISDVAHALDTTRSSAFRITYTLEHLGYLQRVEDTKKYQLGPKVLGLGFAYLSGLGIIESTRRPLQDLADELNVSTHLVQRDGLSVVYVARYAANHHIVSNVQVGTRFPVHATAPGQLLLSELPDQKIVNLCKDLEFERYTKHTPENVTELLQRVAKARIRGYVESWGYFEAALAAVAVSLRNQEGEAIAAVNITCPISQFTRKEFKRTVTERAKTVVDNLSRSLGFKR